MSVDKFKFAGPSVQVAEIDESRIEEPIAGVGPVVIGRTAKGPAMAPVTVSTVAELERIFGAPYNGKTSVVDVWREGNQLAPTYATYAAKAFLQNSSPITVVRTLGTSKDGATGDASAGWNITSISSSAVTQGLFLFNSASSGAISGSLVAIFHGVSVGGTSPFALFISSSANVLTKNKLVYVTGSTIPLALEVVGTDANNRLKAISFDPTKTNFIRKVFNTDPTKVKGGVNSDLAKSKDECYFLAESYESIAQQYVSLPDGYFAAILTLPSTAKSAKMSYQSAESGIVVAQHTNVSGAFDLDFGVDNQYYDGKYPVTELFKFVTLGGGEWEQANIKISIENIKPSPYPLSDPFGTFDVVVRDMYSDEVMESYRGLNLNQDSDNYIAKAIGDTYYYWDYNEGRYKEVGFYPNRSARIRVEMLVDRLDDATLVPFGFYGPFAQKKASILGNGGGFIDSTSVSDLQASLPAGVTGISASFPTINLLTKNTKAASRTTWGMVVNKNYQDLSDLLRINPITHYADKTSGSYPTCFFSLDDVGPSGSGLIWQNGLRKSGKSYSSTGSNDYKTTLNYANSFTLPLYGGFDGVDIFEREPIVNNKILDGKTSESHYAYNTLDVALKSISDKEVIETDIVCIPGLNEKTLIRQLIDVCEQRGDALALIDLKHDYVPEHEDPSLTKLKRLPVVSSAAAEVKELAFDSTYAAAYYPAVYESIENVFLPATVAALGVMGGTEGNSALWFAPAGFVRGGINRSSSGLSVSKAAQHLTSAERDELYNININPLATFPNEGVVMFGQKTLQANPSALSRINVRRLLNYIKRNVEIAAKGVLFEPNVEATWNGFRNRIEPFLKLIKSNFGLEDFRVVLDSKTTTADLVDRNIMYAKILLKPTRTIEYIAVDFVITNTGAVFTE